MATLVCSESSYRFQLQSVYEVKTPIKGHSIDTPWISLLEDGTLVMRSGYAWDGASGPTYDSRYTIGPSAEHDAFYQLMRLKLLPQSIRKAVDKWLRDRLIACGCFYVDNHNSSKIKRVSLRGLVRTRAWGWYYGVRFGGASSAKPKPNKVITVRYPD